MHEVLRVMCPVDRPPTHGNDGYLPSNHASGPSSGVKPTTTNCDRDDRAGGQSPQ